MQSKLQSIESNQTDEKLNQLAVILRQSYNVFNLYGKTPDQMTDVIMAFDMVLEPFTSHEVVGAFRWWLSNKSSMPTPADIRKYIVDEKNKDRAAFSDRIRGKSWGELTEEERATLTKLAKI